MSLRPDKVPLFSPPLLSRAVRTLIILSETSTQELPIIILIPLPLHTHLPRPQSLRQPSRQTRRPSIAPPIATIRRIPSTRTTTHADGTIPRRRWRRRFLSATSRPFRWCRRCWFRFHHSKASGAVDAVGGRRWRNRAGDWSRRSRRRCGFWSFFLEVRGRGPALGGTIKLLGKPPALIIN